MQGVSALKARVSYSGRRPSLSGMNTQAAGRVETPMTLRRKKSQRMPPAWAWGWVRRAVDSDDEKEGLWRPAAAAANEAEIDLEVVTRPR
jgi:hypothetical protein